MVESIAELRQICRKTKGTLSKEVWVQPFFYIRFLRFLSIYFVKLAIYTPLTANGMTFISMLVVVAGGLLLAFQNPIYSFMGILLIVLFSILDCSDGDLARYRKEASLIGRYFDLWVHGVESTAIFIGLTFGVYGSLKSPFVFVFGFVAVSAFLLIALSGALKNYNIQYFATASKSNAILTETRFQKDKKLLGINYYNWKNFFSFFIVPYIILAAIILDIIFPPTTTTFFTYSFPLNWRFATLIMFSLYAILALVIKVGNTLKLKDKLILKEEQD